VCVFICEVIEANRELGAVLMNAEESVAGICWKESREVKLKQQELGAVLVDMANKWCNLRFRNTSWFCGLKQG